MSRRTYAAAQPPPSRWMAGRPIPAQSLQMATQPLPGRPMASLWWLHPSWCVFAALLLYACFPAFDYTKVVPRAYLPGPEYAWGACLLLALGTGAAMMAVQLRRVEAQRRAELLVPAWVMALLLGLTLFAYAYWFAPLASNPQMLQDALAAGRGNVRNSISTTPGLTTMTQFGVAYVIGYMIRLGAKTQRVRLWEHLGLAAVLMCGLIRSIAWGERLAVIELVVCGAVAAFTFVRIRREWLWRAAVLAPLFAPLVVLVAFAGTEYFRSWTYYRNQYDSIWQFSFERLLAYYATASNNGIGLLVENHQWPQYSGRYIAQWLYFMPGLGEAAQNAFGDVSEQYTAFLHQYARPELNNPSGLFPVVFDIGYAGSMLYFLVMGGVIGRFWLGWRRMELGAVLFFPPCMLYLVELLRINYLGSSRFFPVAMALLLIYVAARLGGRRAMVMLVPAAPAVPPAAMAPGRGQHARRPGEALPWGRPLTRPLPISRRTQHP
jgi:hypothetical protein